MGTLPGPLAPVCFGGLFAASVSQIEKGKSIWGNLENKLTRGDNIEESHFTERLWAALLSKRPSASSMLKLVDRISQLEVFSFVDVAGSIRLYCPERKPKKRRFRKRSRKHRRRHDIYCIVAGILPLKKEIQKQC